MLSAPMVEQETRGIGLPTEDLIDLQVIKEGKGIDLPMVALKDHQGNPESRESNDHLTGLNVLRASQESKATDLPMGDPTDLQLSDHLQAKPREKDFPRISMRVGIKMSVEGLKELVRILHPGLMPPNHMTVNLKGGDPKDMEKTALPAHSKRKTVPGKG